MIQGAPSDHSVPIATPLAMSSASASTKREYVRKWYRPLPESGISEFGKWICSEDWQEIKGDLNPTEQVGVFENLVKNKLDLILPQKCVKVNPFVDKPYITAELKILDRQIKREYKKKCKSAKYIRMKKLYDEKLRNAAIAYLEKHVKSIKEDDPGKAYRSLRKMASQPGDCAEDDSFELQSHLEDNLSAEESIEKIANHFSKISQEFPPLQIDLLPKEVQDKLKSVNYLEAPCISDYQVYEKIRKSKKPRSMVPGDLPRKLVQEFSPELAAPAGLIFRNIVQSGHWPKPWRVEYGTPLKKQDNPVTEDQIRIISLTNYLSKVFEQFVIDWLLEYVGPQLDWGQYGGVSGSSISHYLVDFVNFVLYNQDLKTPHATLAVMIDFQKAFNRINHNLIITILSNMGVPGWLLQIIMGFLKERELILRYK